MNDLKPDGAPSEGAAANPGDPWLSVLVPVYRVDKYLEPCLSSLLSQEIDGVEILIVDDGCSPDEARILDEARAAHPHIVRIVTHPANRGLSAARNTLLAHARGEYLWFVDADDLLEPGAIRSLRQALRTHPVDLLMCDFRVFGDRDQAPGSSAGAARSRRVRDQHVRTFAGDSGVRGACPDALVRGLFDAGRMHAWSKVVRRSAWPASLRFPEGRAFEDVAVYPRLALAVDSYVHIPAVWIAYRQRPGSIVAAPSPRQLDDWMGALDGYAHELRARAATWRRETLYSVADFHARSLHYCTKQHRGIARRADVDAALARRLAAWSRVSPLSPRALLWEYLRRRNVKPLVRMLRCLSRRRPMELPNAG